MDAFEAVSPPKPSRTTGKRMFSPAEANRALVLVRRIVADIVAHYRALRELHERYQMFDQQGEIFEAEETRRGYVAATDRLAELREELEEVGCELKDFETGLVDFPSIRDEREVRLCWRLGDGDVAFWHEVSAGFAGRKPLDQSKA
ncbi:MAG TPA: DUF2203 domain-containing protein [Phycisphaerae bacterium]|nr:DUF2203 domain-containing protein [Phycisphaerae bacterium]